MDRFDFEAAITMHRAWKMKFHLAIDSIRGSDYDTEPLGDADACPLGRWLAGNAGELEGNLTAAELIAIHADFHRRSEDIARAIRSGRIVHLADPAVVEFSVLSERIEDLLQRLRSDLGPPPA